MRLTPSYKHIWRAILFITAFFALPAHAATVTWEGEDVLCGLGNVNTSCPNNWSGNSVPTSDDIVVFNASSADADIDEALDVAGIDIQAGYTGSITQANTITVGASNFAQAAGTFTGATQTIDINGNFTLTGGTFTATFGTFTVSGNWAKSGGTFTSGSNTVTFDGTSPQTIDPGGADAGSDFHNLTFNGTDGTWTLAAALEVNNILTLTAGTLDVSASNYGVTVGSSWTNNGGAFTARNGTVTLDAASGTVDIQSGSSAFYNLTLNDGGGTATFELEDVLDVDNNLTIAGGTLDVKSGEDNAITLGGNFVNSDTFTARSGTITFDKSSGTQTYEGGNDFKNIAHSGAGTLQASIGTYSITGTFTNSAGTYDTNSIAHTYTGLATISGGTFSGSGTQAFNDGLTVSGGTYSGSGTADVNGDLTLSSGTLTAPSTLTISGDWSNTGGTFTEGTGTVTFDGSVAQALTGETFYNLTINNSAASPSDTVDVDSSAAVTVTNTLTVTDGQFSPTTASDFASVVINTNGILKPDSSASVTTSGNWTNNGTFTHNSGTVTLDGSDQTLAGASTFNHLTKSVTSAATLTLPAGTTTTVAGTATLNGASGALLSLRSSTSGTVITIANSDTTTASYLDIQDITLTVSASCSPGCVDSGNNTLWTFPAVAAATVSSADTASLPSDNGGGIFYNADGTSQVLIALEQGNVRDEAGQGQRTIVTPMLQPLKVTSRPVDTDQLRRLYLRVAGKVFDLKPDGSSLTYAASLRLPGSVSAYNYALTADYGFTTLTEYGVIKVSQDIVPHINRLFRQAYNRNPTTGEWHHWANRVYRGDKQTLPALLGAMQYQAQLQ